MLGNLLQLYTKSRTFLVMTALAVLPALDLLGQVNVRAIVEPALDLALGDEKGTAIAQHAGALYALGIVFVAKVMRLLTKAPALEKEKLLGSE